jgi:hypothetical protein
MQVLSKDAKIMKLVAQAIVKQNKAISETYVIVVVGINGTVMEALELTLKEISGFIEYSDTNKPDITGCWHILVDKRCFKLARKRILLNLKSWIQLFLDTICKTIPNHFPIPQVNQKSMDKDDDSSVGHASYVSSCAQSYGSFDETNVANKKYFTTYNEPTLRS